MEPVTQMAFGGAREIIFAKDQHQYDSLPALIYQDGRVLTEWSLSEDERAAIARGENLRLWIWTFNQPLQPIKLEITDERKG